jgi:hypothetical protein
MKRILALSLLSLSLFTGIAGAEDAKALKWYEKVAMSGYVDTYYQINLNGISGSTAGRVFDNRQNEFSFSGAKVAISSMDEATKTGGQLDLLYGPVANAAVGNAVEQAFVTFPLGPIAVKLGKMVTHLGYEVIETPANLNYSRPLLFNQVPFYHVGVMANYSPLEGLGLMAGAMNSNSSEVANDEAKDIAAQITFSKISGLSLIGNYYLESNRAATVDAPFENTHYMELVGNYQALPELGVGLDYLYKSTIASTDKDADGNLLGSTSSPKSQGYALYANYATPLSGFSIVPRFEQWYSPDAYAIAFDYTLTLKYAMGAYTHFLEVRSDVAYPGYFTPKGGETELQSNQLTLTYGATYSF